jgi:hypothetical protein
VTDGAIGERRAAGRVGHRLHVRSAHDADAVVRDVGEQLVEFDVLLRVCADQVVRRHPGDGQHRLAVELRVVQAVEQMDAPRARCRQTDAEPAGELRIAARHEGRRLLVAHLHEPNAILALPQRLHDPVDAVTRQPEDDADVPVGERIDEQIGSRRRHRVLSAICGTKPVSGLRRMPSW